jgi:myo-inositol-1(or 4)-monophosphatase
LHSHEGIENVTSELEAAHAAAKQAGEVLRAGFGAEHAITYKGEVDLVTEADREAERVIREELLGAFPTYGYWPRREESLRERRAPAGSWTPWTAPPTMRHRLPIFCVSIALERSGEVVLGVVHDPMGEETFVAEQGRGASLNGEPIRVSDTEEMIQALIATGFPYDRAEMPEALELFGRLAATTRGMRRLGPAALDLCYVASGRLDGYYERGIWPWDLAAGSVILEEAGGKLTNYRGDVLDLDGREIVASNGRLHSAMTRLMGEDDRRGS